MHNQQQVYRFQDKSPSIHESVFLAPGVFVIGDVVIGEHSGIWFNSTIRGDLNSVRIGDYTNVQDNSVLHITRETGPLVIGSYVTIGHAVRLHACTVEDETLVGIGAIVLDGAIVEQRSMVAAGAVVPPGFVVPSGKLVAGVPAKVIRDLREHEVEDLKPHALRYAENARQMLESILGTTGR